MEKGKYDYPLERSDYLPLEPHKESCSPENFRKWLKTYGKSKRLAVDLFSGAGGLSFGVKQAGWTVAAAVDFDERALETHAANFPGMSLKMDLGNSDERDRLIGLLKGVDIDLIAGGPPCQPFSRAGRSKIRDLVANHNRDPEDLRKELWRSYLHVVEEVRPRAVLMENVPDMGLGDDFFVVRTIEQRLEDLGYATQVRLVDAWHYGVPQHRKRLILLARNDVERFDWQPKQEGFTSLQDAIGDLPNLDPKPRKPVGDRELPYRAPEDPSPFVSMMRKDAPEGLIWDHMTRRVRADDHEIFSKHMDSTTLYSEIPEKLRRYSAEHFTDKYKKLAWNELSRSITAHIAKDGYWYIHPVQPRTLTVREAARVQTFPDWFRFAGTRSDAFRQIGNAVPPLLGKAAAEALAPVGDVQARLGGLQPHWRQVREELAAWAEKRRDGDDWWHLPGEQMSPLSAAVVAVLSGTKLPAAQTDEVLAGVRSRKYLTTKAFENLLETAPTERARTRLERLAPLVDDKAAWQKSRRLEIPERLAFKPAEASLYRLLVGEDLLWVGQGALRVAARLNDSDADRTNRLSDGRVNLVRLVGAGDESAPLRMAALRLLGNSVCSAQRPLCSDCPLSKHCPRKSDASDVSAVEANSKPKGKGQRNRKQSPK
ncbi:DNA (cytosine-5-)-methyltransferase [Streptomyces sp. RY43-2]|uniref:Cytosine-specific methyltransferase n=1 Tax=Streptomyces macrolidinus TaxID=2952607 RepID=A0ABT0ZLM0_9ACTN|nr:DNA (cytosine-5-)-methyltransferase [Streptomyces macrolidinus]MCN9244489.1 DNA (cytosine-5-)-methyltransferase [Streptomyces macrolidinus]